MNNIVFVIYGPPSSGKTFEARRLGHELIGSDSTIGGIKAYDRPVAMEFMERPDKKIQLMESAGLTVREIVTGEECRNCKRGQKTRCIPYETFLRGDSTGVTQHVTVVCKNREARKDGNGNHETKTMG